VGNAEVRRYGGEGDELEGAEGKRRRSGPVVFCAQRAGQGGRRRAIATQPKTSAAPSAEKVEVAALQARTVQDTLRQTDG